MNKISLFQFFLLAFIFFISCTAPKKTDQEKEAFQFFPSEESMTVDNDPYFKETKTINSSNGPNSITRNILEDRNGIFWFASWEGIIRYDGNTFTNFTNKDSLRRYHVFSVLEDSKGIIWFGTIGAGIYRYDGKSFRNITTKDGLVNNNLTNIFEDKKGNIWFGTLAGASSYDGKSFRNFTEVEGLPNHDVNAIVEDEDGILWLGTRGEACTFDGKKFSVLSRENGGAFMNVRSIVIDKNKNIWFGGNDGLWSYDGKVFSNYTKNFVGYIYEDKKGNIWTGSVGNNPNNWILSRYDRKADIAQMTATLIKEQEGQIFGIIEDSKGFVWFGNERGICKYDGASFDFFK